MLEYNKDLKMTVCMSSCYQSQVYSSDILMGRLGGEQMLADWQTEFSVFA